MELFESIAKRHSYRGAYRDQSVPREDLVGIVQAGMRAPSGNNAQDTTFVIVDDRQLIVQIAEILGGGQGFRTAKALIACVVDQQPLAEDGRLVFPIENCSAAVENMLLAITALGYASVWYDGSLRRQSRNTAIGQLLGLPEGKIVQVLLPVGVPAAHKEQATKRPFGERAWFNRYAG